MQYILNEPKNPTDYRSPSNLFNPVFSILIWSQDPYWWNSYYHIEDQFFSLGNCFGPCSRDYLSNLALLSPVPWSPTPNFYRITSPDEEIWGAVTPGVLAGDGEFQGAALEKILYLHQRDPETVLGLSEATGDKEGEGPRTSPSSLGPGALDTGHRQNWVSGKAMGQAWNC